MKAIYVLALLTGVISTLAQEVHDRRIVNGLEVDLSPIHKWFADHKGERPMKHWKQVKVFEVKSTVASWDLCSVKNESGQTLDLYLANVPPTIKQFLTAFNEQAQMINQLRAQIILDEQRRDALWNRYINTDSSVVSVTGGSHAPVADNEDTRRSDAYAMDAKLKTERLKLRSLESVYDEAVERASDRVTTFAMFSGRKYGGVEIWDCGRAK